MAITIEPLAGEPVILVRVEGYVDAAAVRDLDLETARLRQGEHVYRIADVRAMDTSLPDMLAIINQESQGAPGSITDSHVTTLLVGDNPWLAFIRETSARQRSRAARIPAFASVDEALIYVRFQRRLAGLGTSFIRLN
jgi:hypothetical protein